MVSRIFDDLVERRRVFAQIATSFLARFSLQHLPIIQAIVSHECQAAQRNHFILTRGAKGFKPVEYNDLELVFDLPVMGDSLSYATRILDGTINDFSGKSARSLSYLTKWEGVILTPQPGYMLVLPISEYLNGLLLRLRNPEDVTTVSLFNVLIIPPLSSAGGLFASGEAFHSRSKVGPTSLYLGFGGCLSPQELYRADIGQKLSIFREPS